MAHSIFEVILRTQGGSPARAESVLGPVGMMGWLTVVQDTLGIDLAGVLTDEVEGVLRPLDCSTAHYHVAPPASNLQAPAGGPATPRRSDGLASLLEVASRTPSAVGSDLRFMRGGVLHRASPRSAIAASAAVCDAARSILD